MTVYSREVKFHSKGTFFSRNLTDETRDVVRESGVENGSVLVYSRHTTGAVLIVEHEAGMLTDMEDVLERVIPADYEYRHHLRGFDENGAAHLRSALLSVSVTVPVVGGELYLGTYQEILVLDMDPGEKIRTVLIQVSGEKKQ